MVALLSLKNIGHRTAEWLQAVGIEDGDDLAEVGVVEAYRRLKAAYPEQVTLNALWALQGAMLGIPWNHLPDDMKADLLRQVETAGTGGGQQ